jgi:hypothetical protein
MKKNTELNQGRKNLSFLASIKNNNSVKEEGKTQGKKKDSAFETEETKTMNPNFSNNHPLFKK